MTGGRYVPVPRPEQRQLNSVSRATDDLLNLLERGVL